MSWETVIGLEIHVQLSTDSKLFSGGSTSFGAEPNTHVDLIDLGSLAFFQLQIEVLFIKLFVLVLQQMQKSIKHQHLIEKIIFILISQKAIK